MKSLILTWLLGLTLCAADFSRPDLTLNNDQILDGTWQCLTYARNGNVQPDKDVWTFKGEKFDCNGSAWHVKRRPEVDSQAIDLVIGTGPSYLPAIWKVENDTLFICYMTSSPKRPPRFVAADGAVLRTFKRLRP